MYELPLIIHALLLFEFVGGLGRLKSLGSAAEPLEEILIWMEEQEPSPPEFLADPDDVPSDKMATLLALLQSMQYTMDCLSVYGCSLSALVARVGKGDDAAFHQAVEIDATIVGAPTMASRLSRAVMLKEQKFLKVYRKALTGPHVARRRYRQLRLMHAMLLDMDAKAFSEMSEEGRYELFVEVLKLYPHDLSDSARALSALFSKWHKEATN